MRSGWHLRGRLSLRHLRLVTVLDEARTLSETAQRLATTQPAVSRMLAEVEQIVGRKLFVRTAKGSFPTPHGASLIRHARWILGDLERLPEEFNMLDQAGEERISVGSNFSPSAMLIPRALIALREVKPNVGVNLRETAVELLLPDLYKRELDIVIARLVPAAQNPDLVQKELIEEPLVVVARNKHPLLMQEVLSWADLEPYPWILPAAGNVVRRGMDLLFEQNKIAPRCAFESVSVLANSILMDELDAITVMPQSVARHYEARNFLDILPVRLPLVFPPLGIIMHRSMEPSPTMLQFIDCITNEARAIAGRRRSRI
ncbi:MAG TPA: LysR family transcriptional regulator [Burkholderiaceae bacterium]|nr:LysR family transcriptional regulator [Burkholderiaceae bacterium]